MAGTIEICNLRNIRKLRFDIPDRGVWLLTAGNGAGKTSLLACIRRIGYANAFPVHFPSSLQSDRLDNHSNGTVTYEVNGETVEYAYRGERWTPRPRSNARLFDKLGYSSVLYIGATADRITPRPEDFSTNNIKQVGSILITAANNIFETTKFSALRSINLSRGVGNDAFVLSLGGNPQTYHSEKHFSLGELCVLKLLKAMKDASNHSLIIVDELEMALHPRAQLRLLQYLEDQAKAKSLTVIFSTHSVTLLKYIDRKKIIYLERQDDDTVIPRIGCFPTYAIGNITADEETLPDILLYVEDVFARDCLISLVEKFSDEKFADPTARPTVKIVPVGPFDAVVMFLDRNRSVMPAHVVQKAVLDEDVSSESVKELERTKNYAQLQKWKRLKDDISFLPFTPEIGIMDYIVDNLVSFEKALRTRCADSQLRISPAVLPYDKALSGKPRRVSAKKAMDALLEYISGKTQRSIEAVREQICGVFANESWLLYRSDIMQLLGPLTK